MLGSFQTVSGRFYSNKCFTNYLILYQNQMKSNCRLSQIFIQVSFSRFEVILFALLFEKPSKMIEDAIWPGTIRKC